MGATEKLATFTVETTFERIPPQVVSFSKQLMLDCIGCALAGSVEPTGRIMTQFTRELGGVEESGVIGGGFRTSAPNAAFANGTLCHCMDYDDMGFYRSHPSAGVVPVLLALGEKLKRSGKEILEAHAVGFEVFGKIAEGSEGVYERGWHPTAIFASMAAAAAAAKLLKLDVEQTMNAFGIVASEASGIRANFGAMAKPLHLGHAARAGTVAALLAKAGFTGRKDIIEHPVGFAYTFMGPGNYDPDKMVEALGKPFSMECTPPTIKKHACCGGNHRAIDAILHLIKEHRIKYDEVHNVVLDCDSRVEHLLAYPEPACGHEGRFSLHYNLAAALLDGKLDRRTHTDERAARPDIHEAVKKVSVVIHPEWDSSYGKRRHPVTINLKDGRSFTHAVDKLRGSPADPLTKEDVLAKYKDCAQTVLSDRHIERSIKLVLRLDELDDIVELMDILITNGVKGGDQ